MTLNLIQLKILVNFHSQSKFYLGFPNKDFKNSVETLVENKLLEHLKIDGIIPDILNDDAFCYRVTDKGRAFINNLLELSGSVMMGVEIEEKEETLYELKQRLNTLPQEDFYEEEEVPWPEEEEEEFYEEE